MFCLSCFWQINYFARYVVYKWSWPNPFGLWVGGCYSLSMWHLLLVASLFLLRWNSGECIVLMIVVLSSLAVVNSNHLFSFPFPATSFLFSPSSHVLFEFIKLAYIFFPCFSFFKFSYPTLSSPLAWVPCC